MNSVGKCSLYDYCLNVLKDIGDNTIDLVIKIL